MFTSPARFLLILAAIFALLTTMWVSAASAQTFGGIGCRPVASGITVCDGAGWRLPSAPRGTVRRSGTPSVVAAAAHQGRVGHTDVVARLGTR